MIPRAIQSHRVLSHVFQGAWEDIGTIRAFFDVNIELTSPNPRFDLFDMTAPIFTRARFLPVSKIEGGTIEDSLISDGCLIQQAHIRESILGVRSRVEPSCHINRTKR